MKTLFQIMMASLAIALAGCVGPYYGKKSQYDKGRWHFWADNESVQQRDQQMLAIGKLQAQPVMVGTMTSTGIVATVISPSGKTAPAGYMGIVSNQSRHRRYNFIINGPENRAFYLDRGREITEYLLPGKYIATIDYGGRQIGPPHIFDVGPEEKSFLGEKCHWYLVAEDGY